MAGGSLLAMTQKLVGSLFGFGFTPSRGEEVLCIPCEFLILCCVMVELFVDNLVLIVKPL